MPRNRTKFAIGKEVENLADEGHDLLDFTEGARGDFHEPDEQGIILRDVVGTKLDNAFGNSINWEGIIKGRQEAIVCLERVTGDDEGVSEGDNLQINLATLIALARYGAKKLLDGMVS
jgi:hypothetical protein